MIVSGAIDFYQNSFIFRERPIRQEACDVPRQLRLTCTHQLPRAKILPDCSCSSAPLSIALVETAVVELDVSKAPQIAYLRCSTWPAELIRTIL